MPMIKVGKRRMGISSRIIHSFLKENQLEYDMDEFIEKHLQKYGQSIRDYVEKLSQESIIDFLDEIAVPYILLNAENHSLHLSVIGATYEIEILCNTKKDHYQCTLLYQGARCIEKSYKRLSSVKHLIIRYMQI
ncbi:hypothetical protein SAMN05444392_11149 [Seinonella peptonophila]|uniref:Uncharacterized protein n=1 Tax=Seinonella peptonophila TaxID=112248 RepID=A0A1M4ZYL7_9BACL|nr:hypothetical protein [Seinonella peptonophila]SHF23071.1 hypothetical protein SAMN05444392_11149 [Seinonella peptonophila]